MTELGDEGYWYQISGSKEPCRGVCFVPLGGPGICEWCGSKWVWCLWRDGWGYRAGHI